MNLKEIVSVLFTLFEEFNLLLIKWGNDFRFMFLGTIYLIVLLNLGMNGVHFFLQPRDMPFDNNKIIYDNIDEGCFIIFEIWMFYICGKAFLIGLKDKWLKT